MNVRSNAVKLSQNIYVHFVIRSHGGWGRFECMMLNKYRVKLVMINYCERWRLCDMQLISDRLGWFSIPVVYIVIVVLERASFISVCAYLWVGGHRSSVK